MVLNKLIFVTVQLLISLSLLWFVGCAGNVPRDERDFSFQFEEAKSLFDKKKYIRSQEEFQLLVVKASHTEIGDDALFYLGESYFLNKEYPMAISQYERLIRRFEFSSFIEKARWRICEGYVAESPKYYHDQSNTNRALEKIQEFLDDYPHSQYNEEAQNTISELRNKLGMKMYEIGVLYIKLRAFDSAIISFNNMLDTYYDTPSAGLAHVGIIKCHSKMLEVDKAVEYLNSKDTFLNNDLKKEASEYIAEARKQISKKKK